MEETNLRMLKTRMQHFLLLTALSLNLLAHTHVADAQKFSLPKGFQLSVKAPTEGKADSELEVSWPKIENAILYEVEIAEQYQEDAQTSAQTITLAGNIATGLGSSEAAGSFTPGSYLRILGSKAGNDGIYRVSGQGLTANTLTLANANLSAETLTVGQAILLKIQAPQWVYALKKTSLFSSQPNRYVFKELNPGVPYVARLRAVATTDEDLEDPQSDFTSPTLPVYTAQQPYYSIELNFEEITTHSMTAVWSTPENNNGQTVDFEVTHASTQDFAKPQSFVTKKTEHTFEDLEPETPIFLRVRPIPPVGKYSQFLQGGHSEAEGTTKPLEPIALNGVISTTQSALGSLLAVWQAPKNLQNENIHYTLTLRKSRTEENEETPILQTHPNLRLTQFRIKGLETLTSYDIAVQAFPEEGNRFHLPSLPIKGTGTTAGSLLDSPANLEATPGIGSLAISWSEVINNLGKFQYKVLVQSTDGFETPGLPDHFITQETQLGPIEKLQKDTEYQVTITAEPLTGNKGDLPSKPISVVVTTLTDEEPTVDVDPEEESPQDSTTTPPAPTPQPQKQN